jgi:hypothetical protein
MSKKKGAQVEVNDLGLGKVVEGISKYEEMRFTNDIRLRYSISTHFESCPSSENCFLN